MMMVKNKWAGIIPLALFIVSIPLANWTLHRYGFKDVWLLGPVASGVVWVGLAFVARDVVQLTLGKLVTLAAIGVGVALSVILADPGLAKASAWAFLLSEVLDFVIYTPLARRQFVLAVVLSSVAGSFLDSALFLRIAFGSYHGWWQLAVAKSLIVGLAAPVAWFIRRQMEADAVPRYQPHGA
jgi:uncharacterized PurR-regulated membrane protein YhhQ (DUF165 family)